jgi:alpha-1,2-mannosyltransferase
MRSKVFSREQLAVAAGAVAVLLWCLTFDGFRLFDFRIFWDAGNRLLDGQPLYPSSAALHANTRDYFVYPPGIAYLFVPLSLLPFAVAGVLYTILSFAALGTALCIVGVRDVRCYLALALWTPVLQAYGLGSVEPFLALGLALGWRYRDRPWLGTVPLGVAVAAKLFLWPVALWFVFTGRLRRAAETTAAALAVIFVPWAFLGFRDLTWYPHVLNLLLENERLTSWSTTSVVRSGNVGAAAVLLEAASVALVAVVARRRDGDRRAFTAAVLASLVLSPLVWIHYSLVLLSPGAIASRRFGWLWALPALAWCPIEENRWHNPWLAIWVYVVMAAVALVTLWNPASPERVLQGLRRRASPEASTAS